MTDTTIKQIIEKAHAGAVKHKKKRNRDRERAHRRHIAKLIADVKEAAERSLEALSRADTVKRQLEEIIGQLEEIIALCATPELEDRVCALPEHHNQLLIGLASTMRHLDLTVDDHVDKYIAWMRGGL